jgi:hypothetical protein
MDDIEMLREARPRRTPSEAGYSAARAALLERIAGPAPEPERGRRFRSPRPGVRLAAVGAVAVTIAAGVTVVQSMGADGNGRPRPVVPGLPGGRVADARVVLAAAADLAQNRPFTPPSAGQWTYTETEYRESGKPGPGVVHTAKTPLKTRIDRTWTRADGLRVAFYDKGKLVISPTGGPGVMPPSDYASLAALPRDPDALLAWAYKQKAPPKSGNPQVVFSLFCSILGYNVLPPALEAAIYRALAKVPGVTLVKNGVDLQGRPALSVGYVIEGWVRQEILLDPRTYVFRGLRSIVIKDHSFAPQGGTLKKGAIDVLATRIAAGIVDRPGQRP